ncbi:MAG: ABC transporter permease, partial [Candidatus Symbiothrix sp.]|nr:ABC transporter permease [Candidatus Symbiothrix sp.]
QSGENAYATLVISENLLTNPSALTLYSQKQVLAGAISTITSQLNDYLSNKKLASYNIPNLKQILEESQVSVNMQILRLNEDGGESASSANEAMIIGMIFTTLIYLFIFAYGAMVMQGVMEEKTNRIIEVMVSSVKPFDLMMGKLIGIGLVGLTQFALWGILIGGTLLSGSLVSGMETGTVTALIATNHLAEISIYFVIFFIGGYLLYASLFAAIGAMVNSQEDTQQYLMPITIIILFALYTGMYSAQNPDGPLAFWASLFPLTSPIVMMTRLPYGVPWWQLAISIALLLLTMVFIVRLAAKIYRTGILMYGKKPTFAEIMKWLKY